MSAPDSPSAAERPGLLNTARQPRTQEELNRIDEDFAERLRRHAAANDVARMCGEGHAP